MSKIGFAGLGIMGRPMAGPHACHRPGPMMRILHFEARVSG